MKATQKTRTDATLPLLLRSFKLPAFVREYGPIAERAAAEGRRAVAGVTCDGQARPCYAVSAERGDTWARGFLHRAQAWTWLD